MSNVKKKSKKAVSKKEVRNLEAEEIIQAFLDLVSNLGDKYESDYIVYVLSGVSMRMLKDTMHPEKFIQLLGIRLQQITMCDECSETKA